MNIRSTPRLGALFGQCLLEVEVEMAHEESLGETLNQYFITTRPSPPGMVHGEDGAARFIFPEHRTFFLRPFRHSSEWKINSKKVSGGMTERLTGKHDARVAKNDGNDWNLCFFFY